MRNGYLIAGVVVVGLIVVYMVSQQTPARTTAGSGLKNDSTFWGFANNILTLTQKIVPFGDNAPPTDAELNRYPSSSGFADHG